MRLNNPRNPGGIKATLAHWYRQLQSEEISNDWVSFNGVEVIKTSEPPAGDEWRIVGSVSDIAAIESIHPDGHLTLEQWLYDDF